MKEKHKILYTINKYLLGGFFLAYYRPKFENKHLVPKDGPIILCGNHVHLFDQCLPILSTKRMLHYMAKKEYFDSPFTFFIKASGCIPVDRSIHDDNAKSSALEVLNEGYALGIYPEGTRNSLACKKDKLKEMYEFVNGEIPFKKFKKIMKKDMVKVSQTDLLLKLLTENKITKDDIKNNIYRVNEYLLELESANVITSNEYYDSLLLPLKYGAVSMAQKTGAIIVPYAITGKYRFSKNNLKVTFLKPFTVSSTDDLNEKNNELAKEIKDELLKYSK